MAMATRESSHGSTSSVAAAAGESKAFPGLWYKRSGGIGSSSEEQPSHPPSWHLCMGGGGIAEYRACLIRSHLKNILLFQL